MGCCGRRVKAAAQLAVPRTTKKAPAAANKEKSFNTAQEPPAYIVDPPLVPEATKTL